MLMRKIFFILMNLVQVSAFAQITSSIPTSSSIANTSVSDLKHWSPFHNPACLSAKIIPQLGFIFENRYITTALAEKCLYLTYPVNHFVAAFSAMHQGFSLYHEILLGLSVSRNFSERFSLGVQFNYHTVYFAPSNAYYAIIYPQIGLIIPIENSFRLGFHVSNPFGSHIKGETQTKYLPAVFSLGCAYDFSPEFCWRFQADKEIRSNYRFASGFDYYMTNQTRFQLGAYIHEFLIPCMGFGFKLSPFTFDLLTELHPLLGLNTIAQIQYCINR